MATSATWTIIFDDKKISKNFNEKKFYVINDDAFWNDPKFSNIWAIQYGTSNASDEVEYRDETPHSTFADANIGDISQFTNKWDAAHLAQLQSDWDNDSRPESEKGARPTAYSS